MLIPRFAAWQTVSANRFRQTGFASGHDRDQFGRWPFAPSPGAARNGRCGKGVKGVTAMATYHSNVSSVQPVEEAEPVIRTISLSDLQEALRLGWEDFKAVPSHAIILCAIYPVLGLILARAVLGYAVIPLLFPLAAGFALLGPFAAVPLYELSRRRELGEEASAWDAFDVVRSPSFGAMLGLGTLLLAWFVTWVATAQAIYVAAFGYEGVAGVSDFIGRVLTTSQGWWLIIVGCGAGFLFALVALCA